MFTRTFKEFVHLIITVAFLGMVLNLTGCGKDINTPVAPVTKPSVPVKPQSVRCPSGYTEVAEGWGRCLCVSIDDKGILNTNDTVACTN